MNWTIFFWRLASDSATGVQELALRWCCVPESESLARCGCAVVAWWRVFVWEGGWVWDRRCGLQCAVLSASAIFLLGVELGGPNVFFFFRVFRYISGLSELVAVRFFPWIFVWMTAHSSKVYKVLCNVLTSDVDGFEVTSQTAAVEYLRIYAWLYLRHLALMYTFSTV